MCFVLSALIVIHADVDTFRIHAATIDGRR
jgi:hypothetical protein